MDIALVEFMEGQLRQTVSSFHRYLYDALPWDSRMFGLVGPRGVGKTTMILQHIKENRDSRRMFYASADHLYFSSHTLVEFADEFAKEGGEQIFIDEIHKYPSWSRELKQIYDSHPDVKICFTGSSVLDIYRGFADLSRRAPVYSMQGLSFREYLCMFQHLDVPVCTIDDIVHLKVEIPGARHPLVFFREYLRLGYYPFSSDENFSLELRQTINQTMEVDIPQYAKMNVSTGRKLKKLLAVIADSVPFKPVMESLARVVGVSRNDIPDYLMYMEQAGMIAQLRDDTGGVMGLGKVEKVYLDNPNIAYLLGGNAANIGNIRETFFYNQARVVCDVTNFRVSDFRIGERTFEVGGKGKGQRQIAAAKEGYVVKDDIEYGSGNVLPLWSFGLLY